jgi:transcriptional regulator with XRE-family HTH domain
MEKFFDLRNEGGPLQVDGAAVQRARWAAGLTQAGLARRVQLLGYYLPQPYVSKLEHGEYRWGFTERMAAALAAALGVGVSEITGGRLLTTADAQSIRELVGQLQNVLGPDAGPQTQIQTA